MVLGLLCYVNIIMERLPRFSSFKFKPWVILIALFLIAANTYILYVVLHMDVVTYTFHDAFEPILFCMYGAAMIILGIQAISYNSIYNNQRSLYYTFFVFGFIASDVTSLFAYYFGFEMYYFFDRFFFLTTLGIFVNYGLKYEGVKEEVNQYGMIDRN